MAKDDNQENQNDILSDIKKIEQAVRAKTLAETISTLKEKAHEIISLKEETVALLEAIGISDSDIKRVVDFVNSLDDVQLSEAEKREIKEDAKEQIKEEKKKASKKVSERPALAGITFGTIVGSDYISSPSLTSGYVGTTSSAPLTTIGINGFNHSQSIGTSSTGNVSFAVNNNVATLTSNSGSLKVKL